MKRHLCCYALLLLLGAAFVPEAHGQGAQLQQFNSRAYSVRTNLSRRVVIPFADHMDRVFGEFKRRFEGFRSRRRGEMPLYLLRTEAQYKAFMQARGINAKNSGGMFFVTQQGSGLATWTADRPRAQTFEVLQHEGFHQFAYNYLGEQLPIWINEGLAQYFEDAVMVRRKMETGLADARRLRLVQAAIEDGDAIPFQNVISIDQEKWAQTLRTDARRASLLYAQAWSIVYFLIHADGEKYQQAFHRYLQFVSDGRHTQQAFEAAFGVETLAPAQKRWRAFALKQKPDPLNIALTRMRFLGQGLRFLKKNNEPMPETLDALRQTLQKRSFRLTYQSHGVKRTFEAKNDDLYTFTRTNGSTGTFVLLNPARDDFPPRIEAPGLDPQPTLVWSSSQDGQLIQDFRYR